MTIRLAINTISILGRATQGVRLINLKPEDSIASVARVVNEAKEELEEGDSAEEDHPEDE